MTLETRLSKLEDKMNITNEIPPLVRIDIQDCSRDSDSQARPAIAIVPGVIGRPGIELTRDQGETETNFLERCEAKYDDFYS